MAAPVVASSSPSNNETNVSLNKVITVTFAEALDATTVVLSNFSLSHVASGTPIKCAISYNAATFTVSLAPANQLFKNSAFKLRIIGSDVASPTGYLKSNDTTALATTITLLFNSGDDIVVTEGQKTNAVQANEGQIRLPSSLKLTSSARFQLVNSIPRDHSAGYTGDTITLTFNRNIDSTSITGGIVISQIPFLGEDGWFARTGASGAHIFEWETNGVLDGVTNAFEPPLWSGRVTGASVIYTALSGQYLKNSKIDIDLYSDTLRDTGSNYLTSDRHIAFTTYSYPSINPRQIQSEVHSVFDSLNLDFVQEMLWKHSIDAYKLIGFDPRQFTSRGYYLDQYVKCNAALEIMSDLFLHKSILAGQTKTLGDFIISYDPGAGNTQNNGIIERLQACIRKAERAINYKAATGRVFIKGWTSATDPGNFRTRLWKNDKMIYNNGLPAPVEHGPVDNTSQQRSAKLPGYYDPWS